MRTSATVACPMVKQSGQCTGSVKALLIGDSGVGKSSLMTRYLKREWNTEKDPTMHVKVETVDFEWRRSIVRLHIWDIGGNDKFRSIIRSYYRGAHSIFLVFDVTNRESFDNIQTWVGDVRRHADGVSFVLIGNKQDRPVASHQVSDEEASSLAISLECKYYPTSIINTNSVDAAFTALLDCGMERSLEVDSSFKLACIERQELTLEEIEAEVANMKTSENFAVALHHVSRFIVDDKFQYSGDARAKTLELLSQLLKRATSIGGGVCQSFNEPTFFKTVFVRLLESEIPGTTATASTLLGFLLDHDTSTVDRRSHFNDQKIFKTVALPLLTCTEAVPAEAIRLLNTLVVGNDLDFAKRRRHLDELMIKNIFTFLSDHMTTWEKNTAALEALSVLTVDDGLQSNAIIEGTRATGLLSRLLISAGSIAGEFDCNPNRAKNIAKMVTQTVLPPFDRMMSSAKTPFESRRVLKAIDAVVRITCLGGMLLPFDAVESCYITAFEVSSKQLLTDAPLVYQSLFDHFALKETVSQNISSFCVDPFCALRQANHDSMASSFSPNVPNFTFFLFPVAARCILPEQHATERNENRDPVFLSAVMWNEVFLPQLLQAATSAATAALLRLIKRIALGVKTFEELDVVPEFLYVVQLAKTVTESNIVDRFQHWLSVTAVVKRLNDQLVGRDEAIKCLLTAVLMERNALLLGPPGTGKTFLCKKVSYAVDLLGSRAKAASDETASTNNPTDLHEAQFFSAIFNSGTSQDEMFGGVDFKRLEQDGAVVRKRRNIVAEGVSLVFLDEIFKVQWSELSKLLPVLDDAAAAERRYSDGSKWHDLDLKTVIAASNEVAVHPSLGALNDRFPFRAYLGFLKSTERAELLCPSASWTRKAKCKPTLADPVLSRSLIDSISGTGQKIPDEWCKPPSSGSHEHTAGAILWRLIERGSTGWAVQEAADVSTPMRGQAKVRGGAHHRPQQQMEETYSEDGLSDRTVRLMGELLPRVAAASGRDYVHVSDLLVLRFMLWRRLEQLEEVTDYLVGEVAAALAETEETDAVLMVHPLVPDSIKKRVHAIADQRRCRN